MRLLLAAAAALLPSIAQAQYHCAYGPWQAIPNQQTEAFMEATNGRPCPIGVRFTANGRAIIHGVSVVNKPRNGTATVSGYRVVYRARPGFSGQDSFTFAMRASLDRIPGVATVRVSVKVR
jgi:hypothetical protein